MDKDAELSQLSEEVGQTDRELFWTPLVPLSKSGAVGDDGIIYMLATIEVPDLAGETMLTKGMDTSYLNVGGKLNYEHGKGVSDWVGRVVEHHVGRVRDIVPAKYWPLLKSPALLDKFGMWVKGKLYKGVESADALRTLFKHNSDHGWGVSVQGFTLARDAKNPALLAKAVIRHLAITPQPVNDCTFAVLAKSLATSYQRQDATGGQAMVPQALGPKVKDLSGAKSTLTKFLKLVKDGHKTVLDGTESYFMATGLDSDTAKVLAKFVRENAGRIVAKSLAGGRPMKCGKCNADLADGVTVCTVCASTAPVSAIAELNKALGEDAPPMLDEESEDAAPPAEEGKCKCGKPLAEGEKQCAECKEKGGEEESESDEAAPPVVPPMEKSLATEEEQPAEQQFLDVEELVKSVDSGLKRMDTNTEILAKALLTTLKENATLKKSLGDLSAQVTGQSTVLNAVSERLGILARVPKPRGGQKVEVVKKSFEGDKGGPAGKPTAEVTVEVRERLKKHIAAGHLTEGEAYALDMGRANVEELVKGLDARHPGEPLNK